ncbi:MAG: iron-sulfur cluster repair di-iron protein [Chitinophagales bacterium]|nr:iron-sulfur cluster repair di-iron protein [Chitinophagales bacterium]
MNVIELKEKKVGDLVKENIKSAHIFKKYGIDFCCGGGITIEKACRKVDVSFDLLTQELLQLANTSATEHQYDKWELDFLSDYITNTHHKYVTEAISLIQAYAQRVAQVHGHACPEVIEINEKFELLVDELSMHMKKEELILFPYIKQLAIAAKYNQPIPIPPFGTVQHPIQMMEMEHESAGTILKKIAVLSNNYTPPEWACNTFKALYAKLDEFEQDLHLHVHLENNILFPKAIELENIISIK